MFSEGPARRNVCVCVCLCVARARASVKHNPILKFRGCLDSVCGAVQLCENAGYSVRACVCLCVCVWLRTVASRGQGGFRAGERGCLTGRRLWCSVSTRGVLSACT